MTTDTRKSVLHVKTDTSEGRLVDRYFEKAFRIGRADSSCRLESPLESSVKLLFARTPLPTLSARPVEEVDRACQPGAGSPPARVNAVSRGTGSATGMVRKGWDLAVPHEPTSGLSVRRDKPACSWE
jgi:hypothetical protein